MESKTVYRTLLLRRRVEEIPPEQLQRFVEVQEAFRRWATEWYKSGFKKPMPDRNPLKYFAEKLRLVLKLIPVNGLKSGEWKVPLPFNAQLRLSNERDISNGVLVDLPRGEVRVRKWGGGTIAVRLREAEARWILERTKEGGRLKLAMAWVGHLRHSNLATFNVALVLAREVTPIDVKRVLAVDLNALHNGVSIATIEGGRILQKGVLKPDLRAIEKLQKKIPRLDELCTEKGEPYCKQSAIAQSRLYRLLRQFEDDVAKKIVKMAVQYKAVVVIDAPKDESIRKIKEGRYDPQRKAMLNVGRLKKRIEQLAEWYGVPYREARLYSTICPRCESKMKELPGRVMRCPKCGFEAPRDKIPLLWAAKLSTQPSFLISPRSSPQSI